MRTPGDVNCGFRSADFGAAARVAGGVTTRAGGVSRGRHASLNLAAHVGDDPAAVSENRARLRAGLGLPGEPLWLDQCHGTQVVTGDGALSGPAPRADASVTRRRGEVLAVLSADCLPVLMWSGDAGVIAAAHAGWRGLAAGVLENTVAAMQADVAGIRAWFGPVIGHEAFEVGEDVRTAFVDADDQAGACFRSAAAKGKWLADLAGLARLRLARVGVRQVASCGLCTWHNPELFFSYRRDGECGRMASLIWMPDE